MEKNDEASRMITSFIQLLRSTLSNPNEFATIQQEMYGLEQYVEIQKFRYDDKFQVIFQCDEEVREKKLPKLLIQPLLENAIFHGVEFRKEDGLIIITACQKKGDLVITVEDNGIGISQEMVEKINEGKIYLNTPDLFAWTLVIVLISLGFEKLFLFLLDLGCSRLERM